MKTVTRTVEARAQAVAVVADLVAQGYWVEIDPLPFDATAVRVKDEFGPREALARLCPPDRRRRVAPDSAADELGATTHVVSAQTEEGATRAAVFARRADRGDEDFPHLIDDGLDYAVTAVTLPEDA